MLATTVEVGASLTAPMSYEEYQALGEIKHTAYYDELVHVNPPTRRHQQVARRLTRLLEDAVPAEYEVLPGAGWRVGSAPWSSPTSWSSAGMRRVQTCSTSLHCSFSRS